MTGQRLVRVWFGSRPVARYCADPEPAAAYAAAMDRRYPGLRITNDPASLTDCTLRRMPGERLWVGEAQAVP